MIVTKLEQNLTLSIDLLRLSLNQTRVTPWRVSARMQVLSAHRRSEPSEGWDKTGVILNF
ncbi:hypothetical protein JOE11_000397 [Robbsia andropogonis]